MQPNALIKSKKKQSEKLSFYPLAGNVLHVRHLAGPAGRRRSAFHRRNHEKRKNLLQNGILNFAISLSQSPVIAFQSYILHLRKRDFLKRGLAIKGLILNFLYLSLLFSLLLAQVKSLEYKLKLRLEDIEVYQSRIHEQDGEISALKNKKEELKG